MSLWLQAVTECLNDGDYAHVRQNLLPMAPIALPKCFVRELEFAERRCRHKKDRLFPIRFLWAMEALEQRNFGLPPLGLTLYHPEKLFDLWERASADLKYRKERKAEGYRFDFVEKAVELTAGWVFIGDAFVDDFLEVEATVGVELLFPDGDEKCAAFQAFKGKRKSVQPEGQSGTGQATPSRPQSFTNGAVMDLKTAVFDPVAKRVEARSDSLMQIGRLGYKNSVGFGIEAWLKVEAIAALGEMVVGVRNKGVDLVLRHGSGQREVELKGTAGGTNRLRYLCEDVRGSSYDAILFLGNGEDPQVKTWKDGCPLPYVGKGGNMCMKLVAHRVFSDGEHDWVIGLIAVGDGS